MPFDIKGGGSIPRPQSSPSSGSDYSSVPRPSATATPPSSSFSNRPSYSGNDSRQHVPQSRPQQSPQRNYDDNRVQRPRDRVRPARSVPSFNIPWGIVLGVIAVIVVIALGITFKDEINSFFIQLLTWLFYLLIILLIIKHIIFPGGRR